MNVTKTEIEKQNWEAAHTWHAGLDLEMDGVNLGDVLTYEMLRLLNLVWLRELEKQKQSPALVTEAAHD